MSTQQAKEWAGLSQKAPSGPGIASTGLDILFSSVLCAVCLEELGDALPECTGPSDDSRNEHLWQAFFTAPVTDDDAASWADPEGAFDVSIPQSINVICVLCGTSADDSSSECKERSLWTKESAIDLQPEDFNES